MVLVYMFDGHYVLLWNFAKIIEFIEENGDADRKGSADVRAETQV